MELLYYCGGAYAHCCHVDPSAAFNLIGFGAHPSPRLFFNRIRGCNSLAI